MGAKRKNPITRKQLTNKTYEIFDGEHEAIVEEDIFYKAQEIINERTSIRIAQARSDALLLEIFIVVVELKCIISV